MQFVRTSFQIKKCFNIFKLSNSISTMVCGYQNLATKNYNYQTGADEKDSLEQTKNINGRYQDKNMDDMNNFPRPVPRPYDVLLEMACVGICRDREHIDKERLNGLPIQKQIIIGHGGSGFVFDVGKYVKNFAIGDRVCFESVLPCQNCCFCVSGQHQLCRNFKPASICSPKLIVLPNYFTVPGDFCHKLPDHVTMEEGALVEPVTIALKALRNCNIESSDRVLIVGAGSIGLVTLQLCKAMGSEVVIIDSHQCRLNIASKLNADHTVICDNRMKTFDIVSKVHKTFKIPPNKAIDCAGMDFTQRLCSYCIHPKGRAISCSFGLLTKNGTVVDTIEQTRKDISIDSRDFKHALDLITGGLVNVKILISHHFDKTEINKGVKTVQNDLNEIVKAIVHIQQKKI